MGNEDKSISGIPISGALAVVALILGLLVIPQEPFKASRPKTQDKSFPCLHEEEDVRARLWQDPFAAVDTQLADKEPDSGRHDISFFEGHISLKERKKILVLGIMVNDGPYAEDIEARTRYRYAALSALGEAGYFPENAMHIGYLKYSKPEAQSYDPLPYEADILRILDILPYEWFEPMKESSSYPHVLVLWLKSSRFSEKPLRKLSYLAELFNKKLTLSQETQKPEYRILGPLDSTCLKAMIEEKKLDENQKENLRNVRVLSWGATLDPERMITDKKLKVNGHKKRDPVKAEIERKCRVNGKKSLEFFRTIGPDKVLADALVDELSYRIKGLVPDKNNEKGKVHMALISEWDTIYGRSLPKAFIESVARKNRLKPEDIHWIYQFGYMRGIDGQVPEAKSEKSQKASTPSGKKTDARNQKIERPEGRGQFDYLRRLAVNLKKLDENITKNYGGRGIQAIGVLGGDVYDKLLVLQALRKLFPDVIFFTTDIDARLLHPDELQWTQNLIIASNFDLRLNIKLQNNTPPFRDNYQTSLFLSTKMALRSESPPSRLSERLGPPLIFEVGKSGAFPFALNRGPLEEIENIGQIFDYPGCATVHPLPPNHGPAWMHSRFMWLGFGTAALFVVAYVAFFFSFWKRRDVKDTQGSIWYALSPGFLVLYVIFLVAAFARIIQSQTGAAEPFAFFEGISIWPTEFLRFLAGGVAIFFIINILIKAKALDSELKQIFPHEPQPNHTGQNQTGAATDKGGNEAEGAEKSLWGEYTKYTRWKLRLPRIFILSLIYCIMCKFIISMLGRPFVPYRGDYSFWVDFFSIKFFSIPLFIFLLICVVDYTIASRWLIRRLAKTQVPWPGPAIRNFIKESDLKASYLNEWVDIQVIAKISETVGRFIYYPFIVILILWTSRLRCFDRWDTPLGLLMVILLALSYTVYCALSLGATAKRAKETLLHRLWEKQLTSKVKTDKEQLKMVSDAIRSIRKGAFVPFFEQPVVRAVSLFLGGGGGLIALNYL